MGIILIVLAWFFGLSQGKLVFRAPLHMPRIYEGAPPGVHVTTVHAYDPDSPRNQVTYSLLDVPDNLFFSIDQLSGNLTTANAIVKDAGQTCNVIVVALSHGVTNYSKMEIAVTRMNRFAPKFSDSIYRVEIHANSSVGDYVTKVSASDQDPLPYNAEIYYRLGQDSNALFFDLETISGQVTLAQPLDPKQKFVSLGVFAEDGGSPKRWARARVDIDVKDISEPLNVEIANATDSTVEICWTKPQYGEVIGYLIKYREAVSNKATGRAFVLNITSNASSKCTVVAKLKPWTDYQYRVYAWNFDEIGLGSESGIMATSPNYCHLNVCKTGQCHSLNVEPGYYCQCDFGYYGNNCQLFDPCSAKPCDNFGSCRNTSHNEFVCDCLSGFSGPRCSVFNPCAIRPSPCLNGATCKSVTSHTYNCLCTSGYYGKTCQRYDPCVSSPCLNDGMCLNVSNSEYTCACRSGFKGLHCSENINECLSFPCQNDGVCVDGVDSYNCECKPGFTGTLCENLVHCSTEITSSEKGIFTWFSTEHGTSAKATCPFGHHPSGPNSTARRRCKLMPNGDVVWSKVNDQGCREEAFRSAEMMTEKLGMLTGDPTNITFPQLREAVNRIVDVLDYALKDKKIAVGMFNIISNMLAVNDSILLQGENGVSESVTRRIVEVVDRFSSEVSIEKGKSFSLETENIAIKAVSWSVDTDEDMPLSFALQSSKLNPSPLYETNNAREPVPQIDPQEMAMINIPVEAVQLAQSKLIHDEVRLKFVAYKNDKLFRNKYTVTRKEKLSCEHNGQVYSMKDRNVLQASIQRYQVTNLSDPVVYVITSPPCVQSVCVYWDTKSNRWATDGITTTQNGNVTTCYSNHLTAFSILLDPTPDTIIPEEHKIPLSIISYIGCGLSILGLLLTIITYSLFRCLNRDRSGKILLNLCVSMLLMNVAFVAGSLQGTRLAGIDVCVTAAVLIHYFLLTSLSWMCVEAVNMYQLLIHVFASSESRFMIKRCFIGWGTPFVVVAITVALHMDEYLGKNEYCMLSPTNPYVYYISFLGPSCLILLVNLTVFLMVARVLFTPRLATKPGIRRSSASTPVVTLAQVRGAFTVMVLLGVTWVFGALAVGEIKLVFQYIFCIANSLQGFLIFLVRCLYYPEARNAWIQLFRNGTLKKYRGMVPPGGSWCGNSSSNQKHNSHHRSVRINSTSSDSTSTVVFNSNYWSRQSQRRDSRTPVSRLSSVSSLLKTANVNSDIGWTRRASTCKTFGHHVSLTNGDVGAQPRNDNENSILPKKITCPVPGGVKDNMDREYPPKFATKNIDQLSTIGYIDDDIPEQYKSVITVDGSHSVSNNHKKDQPNTEESPDLESLSYTRRLTLPLVKHINTDSSNPVPTVNRGYAEIDEPWRPRREIEPARDISEITVSIVNSNHMGKDRNINATETNCKSNGHTNWNGENRSHSPSLVPL